MPSNRRETGPRTLPADSDLAATDQVSQDAAANKKPKGIGNSEPVDEVEADTRHSDGVNPSGSDDGHKRSGAGAALARHSKDAGDKGDAGR
jgi:hypothetical protein